MTLYGIASRQSGDIEGWWRSRENAEQFLATVLREAPEYADDLYVDSVELEQSPNWITARASACVSTGDAGRSA